MRPCEQRSVICAARRINTPSYDFNRRVMTWRRDESGWEQNLRGSAPLTNFDAFHDVVWSSESRSHHVVMVGCLLLPLLLHAAFTPSGA